MLRYWRFHVFRHKANAPSHLSIACLQSTYGYWTRHNLCLPHTKFSVTGQIPGCITTDYKTLVMNNTQPVTWAEVRPHITSFLLKREDTKGC